MITLRQDKNMMDISIHDMMMLDTKVNMLAAFDSAGFKIPKKAPKEVLASAWDKFVHDEPDYIISCLPQEEQKMLTRMVLMKQEECISAPKNPEKFLMMQKLYLVVTFEGKDYWHIYMPDSVRQIISEMLAEDDENFDNLATELAARKQQEMDEAEKNIGKPIPFSPAITANPPQLMEEQQVFCQKLIRPKVLEVVLRLTKVSYMVFYVILQESHIHIACCWDDILDFVWNGVEQPTPWNPYADVKKHFRKKYPVIASLFGQKETKDGNPLPVPYLTTIGFDHQPKKWWLSMKLSDRNVDDFTEWAIYDMTSFDVCADILGNLREANLDIFDEINDSDAKSPREKMHAYFGVTSIPEDEMVDEVLVR